MIAGGIIILTLPFLLRAGLGYYEVQNNNYLNEYYITCLLILYPSGILGFGILFNARGILKKINMEQPFIIENVKRMKNISRLCAGLCCIHAIATFFVNSVFVPILFVVFGLTALFIAVFGELFHKAVLYKEENDYTI